MDAGNPGLVDRRLIYNSKVIKVFSISLGVNVGLGQKLSSWKTKTITRRRIVPSAMNVLLVTKCGVLAN